MDFNIVKQNKIQPDSLLRIFIGIILSIVIASGILSIFFNTELLTFLSHFSLCPFHTITGIPCPGCGMSRAFLLLGQLKIKQALNMNIFSLALFFLMVIYFVIGHIPQRLKNKYIVYTSLSAVLIFWVLRLINL
jgi:hypothetical protein